MNGSNGPPVKICAYYSGFVTKICHLPYIHRELLEPSLINTVLIPNRLFNNYKPRPSTILSLI
jgi:hypothetical protein